MNFEENYKKDLSSYVCQKNGLDYLPTAIAIKELKLVYPTATWSFLPETWYHDGSVMVTVKMEIDGIIHECSLPVMYQPKGGRIQALLNPNAFDINTARQRCLVKCIAQSTGIGLALYTREEFEPPYPDVAELIKVIRASAPDANFKLIVGNAWHLLTLEDQQLIMKEVQLKKEELNAAG